MVTAGVTKIFVNSWKRRHLMPSPLQLRIIGMPFWLLRVPIRGLDIYGEKPLARSIVEGRAMVEAVEKNGRIWQTGSWQRSVANFHRACELVVNGRIGKVEYVEVGLPNGRSSIGTPPEMEVPAELNWEFWLGPAPTVPYRGVSHWDWRWILDYSGGQLTDWAGHHIDIAHWGLGFDRQGPISVEGKGVYPERGHIRRTCGVRFHL